MNVEPLISVIVPVYNVQDYLERCLNSIINNTYHNLQIICVDDGSTDNCLDILNKYKEMDTRIKVIHKENGGIISARNTGLELCSGDFVAFIDSDDWIHKDYFACLIKAQKEGNYDVVICGYKRTKQTDALDFQIAEYKCEELDRKKYMMVPKYKTCVWGKIYKKEAIEMLRFDLDEKVEDAMFNMQVAAKNCNLKAIYVDLPLYAYFFREGSLVHQQGRNEIASLALRYFKDAKKESNPEMRDILYRDCVKRSLAASYHYHVYKEKENEKKLNNVANKSLKQLKEKDFRLFVMVKCPFVYRLFRILDDPTLLDYEKNVRKKLKKEK